LIENSEELDTKKYLLVFADKIADSHLESAISLSGIHLESVA
jgi:hypothetical protein